ncbi:MAG: phosphoribosylformylglycinamidine cyclo-ligase [Gemmatimonadales bacterium]|nr:MAG: phosphoribosylformylglycinamidine cyclo-ligase [Gemmatimonadales bacterium]
MSKAPMDYRSAGVDLDRAHRDKEGLKELVASTRDENTLSEMGLFGGLYRVPGDVEDPVLVSSADGVGTKLKVAIRAGIHDTVGQCLVNHCVNDILVQGARPLFFLDYLATGQVPEGIVPEIVRGVALACRENGCALLGGETAQMPDFYSEGEYDLAGFIVGIVSASRIIDGSRVQDGDALVALPSSGLHTNGYTLARKVFLGRARLSPDDPMPGLEDETVGEALLRVHRSYLPLLRDELDRDAPGTSSDEGGGRSELRALAHITGGGIEGNLPRSLPPGLGADIETSSWKIPPLFQVLAHLGGIDDDEMFRVFNMGVGMIAVVAPEHADGLVDRLRAAGEPAWILGRVTDEHDGVRRI